MDSLDTFDFDTVLDRRGTHSYKWDSKEVLKENLLPLSVADMDFSVPCQVTQALIRRTSMPIYGYEFQPDALKEAVVAWHFQRHGFTVRKEWIRFTPGVINGLAVALLVLTRQNDPIVIQPPVYPPFFRVVAQNQRRLLLNPLHYESATLGYTMDFDALEKLFSKQKPPLMVLCNPHNPVGRVWTREELHRLGALCEKHQVALVSDDIHADIVFSGHRYHPLIGVSETLKNNTIQLMSPGKTFNIPGLRFAYAVIADDTLRKRFSDKLSALALTNTNIFAAVAAQAAYRNGAPWLDRVLEYIRDNYDFLKTTLAEKLPWAKVVPLEGTFLAWIDLRRCKLEHEQLVHIVRTRSKLMLFEGSAFGDAGRGFMRMNLACPRKTVEEAVRRLVEALAQVQTDPPGPVKILDSPSGACTCCDE